MAKHDGMEEFELIGIRVNYETRYGLGHEPEQIPVSVTDLYRSRKTGEVFEVTNPND